MSNLILISMFALLLTVVMQKPTSLIGKNNTLVSLCTMAMFFGVLQASNHKDSNLFNLYYTSIGVLCMNLLWVFLATREKILLALSLMPSLGLFVFDFCLKKAGVIPFHSNNPVFSQIFFVFFVLQFIYFMKDFSEDTDDQELYTHNTYNGIS